MAKLVASRAVRSRSTLLMAITTKVHAGRDFLLQHVARLHWSMTFGALQPCLDMSRMAKEYKIRNSVDRHPGDFLALLGGIPDFATSGLSFFTVSWHFMQKAADGIFASSPLSTPVWQKLHGRPTSVACVLWLNAMGCGATDWGSVSFCSPSSLPGRATKAQKTG